MGWGGRASAWDALACLLSMPWMSGRSCRPGRLGLGPQVAARWGGGTRRLLGRSFSDAGWLPSGLSFRLNLARLTVAWPAANWWLGPSATAPVSSSTVDCACSAVPPPTLRWARLGPSSQWWGWAGSPGGPACRVPSASPGPLWVGFRYPWAGGRGGLRVAVATVADGGVGPLLQVVRRCLGFQSPRSSGGWTEFR